MKHKVRVGIAFTFYLDNESKGLWLWQINALIREFIEQHLPSGWVMAVYATEIDGKKVENHYE